ATRTGSSSAATSSPTSRASGPASRRPPSSIRSAGRTTSRTGWWSGPRSASTTPPELRRSTTAPRGSSSRPPRMRSSVSEDAPGSGAHPGRLRGRSPQIGHLGGEALEAVAGQDDRAGVGGDPDAGSVGRPARRAGVFSRDPQLVGLAADVNGDPVLAAAIGDAIGFDPIAIRPEVLAARLVAEQDAHLAAVLHVVVAHHVVGVMVADGDAVVAVRDDPVLLGQAVLDAPAPEQADRVPLQAIAADQGPLRARAGVDAEVGVVVAVAALDYHVVADLETDAVAVVVPGRDAADREAVAVLEEDAAGVVAVEALVVRPVPVEREILDDDVGDPLG